MAGPEGQIPKPQTKKVQTSAGSKAGLRPGAPTKPIVGQSVPPVKIPNVGK